MAVASFEMVLEQVGDKGRHQRLLYWLFVVPINFLIPWVTLVPIFLTSTPAHWCHVPGRPSTLSNEQWKTLTIPRTGEDGAGEFESCQQYNATVETLLTLLQQITAEGGNLTSLAATLNDTYGTMECQAEWDYDRTTYTQTLTTRQHWVCGRASMGSTWMSVGVAGNVVGTLVFNSLSDILGRSPVLVVAVMTYAVFGVARLYVTSYAGLMSTMFLASTSFPPILELTLIIVLEQVSHNWRSRITASSFLLWTAGSSLLPLLAWLTRDWQLLGLITSLPFFFFAICWWLLPESPRWLLSQSRLKQCEELLRKIAHRNKRNVPENLEETLSNLSQIHETGRNYGALQLCQYPTVRLRTFLLTACYTLNNFFYYGLIYNMSNVSGNEFINFFLISVTELPSNLIGWWASQLVGRRWTAAGGFAFASAFVFITAFVPSESIWASVVLLILSKMFITISFLLVYIQCAEIYPTTHCSCGTGLSSFVSSCFGVAAPYISYMAIYGHWVPYAILFLVGIFGFLCASFLPETLNMDLPQALKDADSYLTSEKYWSYKGRRLKSGRVAITQVNGEDTGIVNKAMSEDDIPTKTNSSM